VISKIVGDAIIICDQCDLILQEVALNTGDKASCGRCGVIIYRSQPRGLQYSLAFSLTASALFALSIFFPIVTIHSQGLSNSATLLEAAHRLIIDGIPSIAALVFATTFLMPLLEIMALVYLLFPLNLGRLPKYYSFAFRLVHFVKPWAMIEVFMLALLVTIAKLNAFVSVSPDIGLAAFVLLMLSITAAATNFDPHNFWRQVSLLKASRSGQC
jgi:paraquat-inducible protein A